MSEALALTAGKIDLSGRVIVFERLEPRRADAAELLDLVHAVREARS